MGEVLEALKRNKYLDDKRGIRDERVKVLSNIIFDLNDETLRRLAGTGKEGRGVTTAAMYHLSKVCYFLYG